MEMKQDLWVDLPADLMINILIRLEIGSIIRCKCVCKSWLDLIKSCDFGVTHLCNVKPIPGLAFFEKHSKLCHFYKFVDELELDPNNPELYFSVAMKLRLPAPLKNVEIRDSSVNGLFLFSDRTVCPHNHFVCNPLTGDYIKLPSLVHYEERHGIGFGVSKVSREYKIVRVLTNKCEVYTLGRGSWRSVAPPSYDHDHISAATFLNGNLHWMLRDHPTTVDGISCIDLETEVFTMFSPPPVDAAADGLEVHSAICVLEERLGFSHNVLNDNGRLIIWLMNEYGDDKSWTRKFSVTSDPELFPDRIHDRYNYRNEVVIPIKVLGDGDMIIAQLRYTRRLFIFTKTNNAFEFINMPFDNLKLSYAPSFLSLKTFSDPICG